jgi:HEAT repeat protein
MAIGKIGGKSVARELRSMLQDEDKDVRKRARNALRDIYGSDDF